MASSWGIEYLSPDELTATLRPRDAVEAIANALAAGLDPGADPPRTVLDLQDGIGQLLTMPSAFRSATGVKIITAAPDNPRRGLPRIQGIYLLFEPVTLRLLAAIDGAALTAIRTPAVSVAAVLPLLKRERPLKVLVFGAGPQGVGHVKTLRDVGLYLEDVTYAVRHPERVDASRLDGADLIHQRESRRCVPRADLVVCATTSPVPVFDSHDLKPNAVVIAVGSHEPTAREVDASLVGRSHVIVEDIPTALRESGDVVLAIDEGAVSESSLISMADVVRGAVCPDDSRPVLFTGSGMSWQDLVVAEAAMRKRHGEPR